MRRINVLMSKRAMAINAKYSNATTRVAPGMATKNAAQNKKSSLNHHTQISQIKGPPCHKKFPCFHEEGGFYLAESISIFFCRFFATVYAYYDIKSISASFSRSFLSKVPQQFRNL